jgi:hypothetical protein
MQNLLTETIEFLKSLGSFFIKNTFGRITLIGAFLTILQTLGILTPIINSFKTFFANLFKILNSMHYGVPLYYWLIILFLLIGLFFWLLRESSYLRLVSGAFRDDFDKDLGNWEFGGEGWKTEKDENRPILSVSQSGDGGITKKGFSWCDYEFSFDCKIINKNVGWLVRAEHRNKYLMIQLNMENSEDPKFRLHLRIPHRKNRPDWIIMQVDPINLDKPLKLFEWIKVRIVVLGSNIDIYLNSHHTAHYFIADPIRWQEKYKGINEGDIDYEPEDYIMSINYSTGKVGFRCDRDEHAHIRNVKVKPIW